MLSLGDIARPVQVEAPSVQADTSTRTVEEKPAREQIPPRMEIVSLPGKDNWTNLKIKLNRYSTSAPLIAAALSGSTGLSQTEILTRINELNQFHKEIASKIAEQLWPVGNVPPSALAVIRKSIAGNVIDLWEHNKSAQDPIKAQTAAEIFVSCMPEIDMHADEIFEQKDQIALPVLTEASVGAAISAKLIKCLQEYPELIKKLYLGQNSIPQVALAMSKDAIARAKDISSAITVHKNLTIQDSKHKDVAYQSTLKTIGSLYESSIEMAVAQINTKLWEVKTKDKPGRQAYMAEIQKYQMGQLYDNVNKKINALVSIVYTQNQVNPKVSHSDEPAEETGFSPRR